MTLYIGQYTAAASYYNPNTMTKSAGYIAANPYTQRVSVAAGFNNAQAAAGVFAIAGQNGALIAGGKIDKVNQTASGSLYAAGVNGNWLYAEGSIDKQNKTADLNSQSSAGYTNLHLDQAGMDLYAANPFFTANVTDGAGTITTSKGRTIVLA